MKSSTRSSASPPIGDLQRQRQAHDGHPTTCRQSHRRYADSTIERIQREARRRAGSRLLCDSHPGEPPASRTGLPSCLGSSGWSAVRHRRLEAACHPRHRDRRAHLRLGPLHPPTTSSIDMPQNQRPADGAAASILSNIRGLALLPIRETKPCSPIPPSTCCTSPRPSGMAKAFGETRSSGPRPTTLTHPEWLGLLLDHEASYRRDQRLACPAAAMPGSPSGRRRGRRLSPPRAASIARCSNKLTEGSWIDAHDNYDPSADRLASAKLACLKRSATKPVATIAPSSTNAFPSSSPDLALARGDGRYARLHERWVAAACHPRRLGS